MSREQVSTCEHTILSTMLCPTLVLSMSIFTSDFQ